MVARSAAILGTAFTFFAASDKILAQVISGPVSSPDQVSYPLNIRGTVVSASLIY